MAASPPFSGIKYKAMDSEGNPAPVNADAIRRRMKRRLNASSMSSDGSKDQSGNSTASSMRRAMY